MNEKSLIPSLRFAGFTDAWERRKLGELAEFRRGLTYSPSDISSSGIRVLRSSNINEDTFILADDDVYVKETAVNIPLVAKGDILITAANGSSRLVGKHALIIDDTNKMVHGGFMLLAHPYGHSAFVNALMHAPWYSSFIRTYIAGGNGAIGNLNKTDLETQEVASAPEQEQDKIGSLFTSIDRLITLHQRKHEKLRNIKKAMLDKMFPKNGELFPEVRFAGFTAAWEQRKLGDVCCSLEYGLNAAAKEYDGENKYIRITDIDDNTRLFLTSDLTSPDADLNDAGRYRLKTGDIVFARTGASVGKSYIYKKSDGTVYYAGFLIRAKVKQEYSADFVFQNTLSQNYEKYILITSQRSGQPGVNAQEYAEYTFSIPEYEEQKGIGTFLTKLDDLITLHQRKLEKLQNIKKACLEKMFV